MISQAELGRRIAAARRAAGLNQGELAAKAGRSQAYISLVERGAIDNPGWTTIRAIEDALKLRPGQLTADSDDSPSRRSARSASKRSA